MPAIDIAAFKWGSAYSSEHVNRLRAMVLLHLPAEVTFHCVTDDTVGLHPAIVTHDLAESLDGAPDLGHGWKLSAFSPDFLGLGGRQLVIADIDLVVLGSLDFLLERPDLDFVIAPGRNQWGGARGHAALYRLRVGANPQVWSGLVGDPEAAIAACQHHHGPPGHISEQMWLDHSFPEMAFFPDGLVAYYRQDCGAQGRYLLGSVGRRLGLSTALWGVARPPAGTRVVSFAGRTNPGDVADHHHHEWRRAPFVREHWHE
jgi:hypothetical protein